MRQIAEVKCDNANPSVFPVDPLSALALLNQFTGATGFYGPIFKLSGDDGEVGPYVAHLSPHFHGVQRRQIGYLKTNPQNPEGLLNSGACYGIPEGSPFCLTLPQLLLPQWTCRFPEKQFRKMVAAGRLVSRDLPTGGTVYELEELISGSLPYALREAMTSDQQWRLGVRRMAWRSGIHAKALLYPGSPEERASNPNSHFELRKQASPSTGSNALAALRNHYCGQLPSGLVELPAGDGTTYFGIDSVACAELDWQCGMLLSS